MFIDNKQVSPCLGPGLVCFFSQKLKECTGLYIKYINLTYYVSVLEDCSADPSNPISHAHVFLLYATYYRNLA